MDESLYIILNQYKKEHISEEETIKLIEDLYRYRNIVYTTYPYPQITHENTHFPKYEVTCDTTK